MAEYWLECVLSDGQFSTEKGVKVTDWKGEEDSLFCDKSMVRRSGSIQVVTGHNPGWMKVSVLEEHNDKALISLPYETFTGTKYMTVWKHQLTEGNPVAPG